MPATDHRNVFARMRADARRLLGVAQTQSLRAGMLRLIDVYDMLEPLFNAQPSKTPLRKQPLRERRVYNAQLQLCADEGRDAFYAGWPITDCPYTATGQSPQRNRWEGAWKNAQALPNPGNSPELPNSEDQA
jgi:ribosome modulation factor